MILELVTRSPEGTRDIGARIGMLCQPGDVFLLAGAMGAGKTCLTQGIAWGLGISEYAASPSFTIVRELHGRLPLYHIDLYRLERLDEIAELGLDEYLNGQGVTVIEWAAKATGLLPAEHMLVSIEYISESERRFRLEPHGKRYERMLRGLQTAIPNNAEDRAG